MGAAEKIVGWVGVLAIRIASDTMFAITKRTAWRWEVPKRKRSIFSSLLSLLLVRIRGACWVMEAVTPWLQRRFCLITCMSLLGHSAGTDIFSL